ncbi:MAG TPA: cupredoxin domain-containing protein [Anaerolineales bacterium]|nr:cupredoxin domain-containing protein [Anaerolineales bacterium]
MGKSTRASRKLARQRQKRARSLIFAGIVLAVLGLAGYLLKPVLFRTPPPPMAGKVIDIAADMAGFSLNEIRLKVGQPVTIRLESLDNQHHTDGGGKHQFAVDELGVDIIAQPLSTNYTTFTPDTPGTYTFYCDICCGGRANPTMNGTLIVES